MNWYFEVLSGGIWYRQPGDHATFVAVQREAIANKRYPYRIRSEHKPQTSQRLTEINLPTPE